MLVAILHNAVAANARPDERDVLVQVDEVQAALRRLGHETLALPCDLDLQATSGELARLRPAVVFNLVESLGGFDRLQQFAPALLEVLQIPYTGASAAALVLTNDKLLAKRQMRAAGLPTPDWLMLDDVGADVGEPLAAEAYIIKAVGEHASVGIDDNSVVRGLSRAALLTRLREHSARLGKPCFAEAFISGREFNLSVLAGPAIQFEISDLRSQIPNGGPALASSLVPPYQAIQPRSVPTTLPPAEIDFSRFPPGKPRIVGYRAKWDETAKEFHDTPRTFDSPPADRSLRDELCDLAIRTWQLFDLRGYARIDFRVDERGRPWILEVNANPCLSPDAGFYAALTQAGLSFDEAVERIVADALAG